MQEVIQFLNENPVQYLATVGRDGKAKCRPFMFAGEKDGKLWFCTNNTKEVYQDMLMNPNVELSVASPAYAWIRLNGKVVFEDNRAVCQRSISDTGQSDLRRLLSGGRARCDRRFLRQSAAGNHALTDKPADR